jgi:hypothetical protein
MARTDSCVSFRPFLSTSHGLSFLSDAAAHKACFDQWEHREVFLQIYAAFEQMMASRPRELDYRTGEEWLRVKGAEFDAFAAALDPSKKH